jgi:hypothetical protein
MKVGDIVKRTTPAPGNEAARYILVEHHGDEGTIKPVGGSGKPNERVRLADLSLAENAPGVVDPEDD